MSSVSPIRRLMLRARFMRKMVAHTALAVVASCAFAPIAWSQACAPGACGREGARPCNFWERIPSCDPLLVESGGCCRHPACGRGGERACVVVERVPSCDGGLVEGNGRCVMPTPCGGEGQRPCIFWEVVPSCEVNLVEEPLGVACKHPPCGREGEAACTVGQRIPSCDVGLVERSGRCGLATPCGGETQRACPFWERPFPCDASLVNTNGMCAHPPCGRLGEVACTVNVRVPSCDPTLVEIAGRCAHPPCGTEGQRPCALVERIPSCDAGLIERPLGVSCVHPPCGREGGRACLITERVPSCDGDLVEAGGVCVSASPCVLADSRVAVTRPRMASPSPLAAMRISPKGLVATRANGGAIRLEWDAVSGATGFVVSRGGRRLGSLGPNARSFDDSGLADGLHEYVVQALPARPKVIDARVSVRVGRFNIVVLGDSVAWGQGLSDAHKFSSQTADAVSAAIQMPVNIVMAAHSGANVIPPTGSRPSDEAAATPGEIPNTFPTMVKQVELAAASLPPGSPADLVLIAGCINDVGAASIMNPTNNAAQIGGLAESACGIPMMDLLSRVGGRFPGARIVLLGYYPLVSNASDLTAIGAFMALSGVAVTAGTAALGVPSVNPVTGAIIGGAVTEVTQRLAAMNAQAFYVTATRVLARSARAVNQRIEGRVSFACPAFTPANAYGAPQSWLWLIPAGGTSNDEVNQARNQICSRDDLLTTAGGTPGSLGLSRTKCRVAALGHPNLLGARAYFTAIDAEISAFYPYWREAFAPVQRGR